jgi:hypothetical protein
MRSIRCLLVVAFAGLAACCGSSGSQTQLLAHTSYRFPLTVRNNTAVGMTVVVCLGVATKGTGCGSRATALIAPGHSAAFQVPERSDSFIVARDKGGTRCTEIPGGGEGFITSAHVNLRGGTNRANCKGLAKRAI